MQGGSINAQERHYDVFIPTVEQPKCPLCGGYMHVRIGTKTKLGEWSCMGSDCVGTAKLKDSHLKKIKVNNPNL